MEGRVFILITVPVWMDGPVSDVSKVNTTVIAGRVYTRVGGWSTNVKTQFRCSFFSILGFFLFLSSIQIRCDFCSPLTETLTLTWNLAIITSIISWFLQNVLNKDLCSNFKKICTVKSPYLFFVNMSRDMPWLTIMPSAKWCAPNPYSCDLST